MHHGIKNIAFLFIMCLFSECSGNSSVNSIMALLEGQQRFKRVYNYLYVLNTKIGCVYFNSNTIYKSQHNDECMKLSGSSQLTTTMHHDDRVCMCVRRDTWQRMREHKTILVLLSINYQLL